MKTDNDNGMYLKVADALENAALVLSIRKWWTQKSYSRDKKNNITHPFHVDCCSFCTKGALIAQSLDKKELALASATFKKVTGFNMIAFNDKVSTTNKNVAVACWEAAQRLRANIT